MVVSVTLSFLLYSFIRQHVYVCVYIYIYIYIYINYNWPIGIMVRVFTNGLGVQC